MLHIIKYLCVISYWYVLHHICLTESEFHTFNIGSVFWRDYMIYMYLWVMVDSWWNELTKWCHETSTKRRTWPSQRVPVLFNICLYIAWSYLWVLFYFILMIVPLISTSVCSWNHAFRIYVLWQICRRTIVIFWDFVVYHIFHPQICTKIINENDLGYAILGWLEHWLMI